MKFILPVFLLIVLPVISHAQAKQKYKDSLLTALKNASNDTIRLDINRKLGFYYQDSEPDTALNYHENQLALAKKLHLKLWEADAYEQIGYCYSSNFNLPAAYENYMVGLKIAEDPSSAANGYGYSDFSFSKSPDDARRSIVGMIHFELGAFYFRSRYYKKALTHLFEAAEIGESLNNQKILSLSNRDIGYCYLNYSNKPDSAFIFFQKALKYYQNSPYKKSLDAIYWMIGVYYLQKQAYDSAKIYLRNAFDKSVNFSSRISSANTRASLGQVYIATGQLDSALTYTLQAFRIADSLNYLPGEVNYFIQLSTIYKLKKEYAIAFDYLEKGRTWETRLIIIISTSLCSFKT